MKIFNEDIVKEACEACSVTDLSKATIGETVLVAQYLEKATGIPFIRMDQGTPGLEINRFGVESEIEALKQGLGCQYPAASGVKELKEAAAEFIKAFMNIGISPEGCIPTTGSVAGSFGAFIACTQRIPGKDKILFIDPGFPIQKAQLSILGIEYRFFDFYSYRGADRLGKKIEEELSRGDIAAIVYSNPNNPTWACFDEGELKAIGTLATRYDVVVMEDLAYFCMDYRHDLGHPYKEPYLPTVARYTDNYILLLSASKIFSYAGQRIALCCISDSLYAKKYPALAERYSNTGEFGSTFISAIMYMITSGSTATTQYGYARMLRLSCEGKIDFVEDTREYERRTKKLKEIFLSHGFHIVYDRDVEEAVGDGFFFTIGYGNMTGEELVKELVYYGVSCICLSVTGSRQAGVRACSSRANGKVFSMLDERMAKFESDHVLEQA